jgi:hypothetical protein
VNTQAFPPAIGIAQPQIHATFTYQRTRKSIQQKKHENFESWELSPGGEKGSSFHLFALDFLWNLGRAWIPALLLFFLNIFI